MSIVNKDGEDIFLSNADCIVNPTNSIGVMGGGLAKQFADRYPDICNAYNWMSKHSQRHLPAPVLLPPVIFGLWNGASPNIMMFPTKIDWRNPSKYEYIEDNMQLAFLHLINHGLQSVAFPKLGCGLGGLEWSSVLRIIREHSAGWPDIEVQLY